MIIVIVNQKVTMLSKLIIGKYVCIFHLATNTCNHPATMTCRLDD